MREGTSYQYAVGRIRALETKLMRPSDLCALAEENDAGRLVSSLYQFGYPEVTDADRERYGAEQSGQSAGLLLLYEKLVTDFRNDQVRELMKFVPEPEVAGGFLCDTDFANAKTCVKYAARGVLTGNTLSGRGGNIPCDVLSACVMKGDTGILPETIAKGIKDASAELAATGTPRFADFILDRAYFAELRRIASGSCPRSRRFLNGYIDSWADIKNMLAFARISGRRYPEEEFGRCYISGSIPEEQFKAALSSGTDPWENTAYSGIFAAADGAVPDISESERRADDMLLELACSRIGDTDTLGPVFAFLSSRKREIMNIRLILIGKRSGIAPGQLKKLIRKTRCGS